MTDAQFEQIKRTLDALASKLAVELAARDSQLRELLRAVEVITPEVRRLREAFDQLGSRKR